MSVLIPSGVSQAKRLSDLREEGWLFSRATVYCMLNLAPSPAILLLLGRQFKSYAPVFKWMQVALCCFTEFHRQFLMICLFTYFN